MCNRPSLPDYREIPTKHMHQDDWGALFYRIPESCGVPNHPALPPYSSQHIKTIHPFLQNTGKSNNCCLEGNTLQITWILHPKSILTPASQVSQNSILAFTDVVQNTGHSYYFSQVLISCLEPLNLPSTPQFPKGTPHFHPAAACTA